ncbi:hypothetical protein GCM10009715_00160 [Paeniglutamicibacter psychrophenolicus]|uniref:Chloramphenicol 3-O-phosphotransferase n=1 Tax=Paeniglutamicibacter psychrophenolicus TaxID=257454 RepID=A0ABS4WKI6_9MICC|nr:AAA family ATPase [Paeniglutamicibacter psychrophenolicus]MBP2376089.1 chloramphenicol 3-O-phosphotransferase [Paeniglutamicibacter psychrophenolicus]
MAQIIWLNGAFGSGKTTTANELVELIPGARTFDPEIVGFMLRHYISEPVPDFQDWPAWRALVPQVADQMLKHYGGVLVAPMTVMRRNYLTEILDGLSHRGIEHHHVLLDVRKDELVRRIETDTIETGARQWRLDHVESYLENRSWLSSLSHVVDTTAMDAGEAARTIAGRLAVTQA